MLLQPFWQMWGRCEPERAEVKEAQNQPGRLCPSLLARRRRGGRPPTRRSPQKAEHPQPCSIAASPEGSQGSGTAEKCSATGARVPPARGLARTLAQSPAPQGSRFSWDRGLAGRTLGARPARAGEQGSRLRWPRRPPAGGSPGCGTAVPGARQRRWSWGQRHTPPRPARVGMLGLGVVRGCWECAGVGVIPVPACGAL